MPEYPHIRRIGDRENEGVLRCDALAIEEKVDGANFRFARFDDDQEAPRIIFGSRERVLGPFRGNVWVNNSRQFKKVIDFLSSRLKVEDLNPSFVYFGEDLSHPHTVKYDSAPQFVGFDIMAIAPEGSVVERKGGAAFLSTDAKRKEFERLSLDFIEPWSVLKNPQPEELEAFLKQTRYQTKMPEGIVIKNYQRLNRWGRPLFAKIVNEDFKEVNKAVWRGIKRDRNCEMEIAEAFVTQPRVRKIALKMVEQGDAAALEMAMMPTLYANVVYNVLQEEIHTIADKWPSIDFGQLNREVAKQTARHLEELIAENAKGE
jgi:ATP-dependent RNA circularization protein (DNA/RNA ligase family)